MHLTAQRHGGIRFMGTGLLVGALLLCGCSRSADEAAAAPDATATTTEAQQAAAPPPPAAAPPPPTDEAANWSAESLDELMAPIALYPDPILAQVLTAATQPQEVMDAGNWLIDNAALKDDALSAAAASASFTPSVQALVHFPTVMDMMCREMDWTSQVGSAFSADQAAVLASVQRLRMQAKEAGTLATSPQMTVEQTVQADKDVIVIQPADPKVVYVPQYEPAQVYAPAPVAAPVAATAPAAAPASTTESSGITKSEAVMGGLLAFGAGVLVANLFDDDDDHDNDDWYGHGYPNWGYGGVYYGPRPYYPHNTYIYAPRYPGYRPQHYYRAPANYAHRYNATNGRSAGRATAGHSYFNRFEENRNRIAGYTPRSPITGERGKPVSAYKESGPATRAAAARTGAAATSASRPRSPITTGTPAVKGNIANPRDARPNIRPDRGYPLPSGDRADGSLRQTRTDSALSGAGRRDGPRERAASERGRESMRGSASVSRPAKSGAQRPSTRASSPRRPSRQ